MNNMNHFKTKLLLEKGTKLPFAKIEYLDKEANEHTALMLIDSGSETSILFEGAELSYKTIERERKHTISGLGNSPKEVTDVEFSFTLESSIFKEEFSILDIKFPQPKEYPVIGALGKDFMLKYGLALDYSDNSLHTSSLAQSDILKIDYDYFFPMNITKNPYRLPVVPLELNGKEIVAVADSGSTNNIISIKSMAESKVEFHHIGSGYPITGTNGDIKNIEGIIPFNLVSVMQDNESELPVEAHFRICKDYIIPEMDAMDGNESIKIPPVEAILSSAFMASQGWILDFGTDIIFKPASKRLEQFTTTVHDNH